MSRFVVFAGVFTVVAVGSVLAFGASSSVDPLDRHSARIERAKQRAQAAVDTAQRGLAQAWRSIRTPSDPSLALALVPISDGTYPCQSLDCIDQREQNAWEDRPEHIRMTAFVEAYMDTKRKPRLRKRKRARRRIVIARR